MVFMLFIGEFIPPPMMGEFMFMFILGECTFILGE